jgi:hypothetical protein
MNIFSVLSQGKGRLNEENMSAILGYLLSPNQSHGFGDLFLRSFLENLQKVIGEENRFKDLLCDKNPIKADVILESSYSLDDKKWFVDVEIRLFTRSKNQDSDLTEVHRIAIENKIKPQSANVLQFLSEFEAIHSDALEEGDIDITMVFLTPEGNYQGFVSEYDALDESKLGKHRKAWLRWAGEGERTISSLIKDMLSKELLGEVPPINEYVRHTLKAFIYYISQYSNTQRTDFHPGEILDYLIVHLSNGTYRLEQYESSTIRVYCFETQEYVTAKPILRRIIDEKGLNVSLYLQSGTLKNTRILGRDIIKALKENMSE